VRDGIAALRIEKSQGEMIVSIPILPILQRTPYPPRPSAPYIPPSVEKAMARRYHFH